MVGELEDQLERKKIKTTHKSLTLVGEGERLVFVYQINDGLQFESAVVAFVEQIDRQQEGLSGFGVVGGEYRTDRYLLRTGVEQTDQQRVQE